jgi:hypothetical protein
VTVILKSFLLDGTKICLRLALSGVKASHGCKLEDRSRVPPLM